MHVARHWRENTGNVSQLSLISSVLIFLGTYLLAGCAAQPGQQPAEPTPTFAAQIAQGRQLFTVHCASCHAVEGDTIIVGPSLSGLIDRIAQRAPELTAEQYIEQSILQPSAILAPGFDDLMPSNIGKRLSGEELDAIVTYVLSIE